MSKKLLSIFILILTFTFTTEALASFTFSSSAITGAGATSVNTGSLLLSGSTSGTVTIAPAATAGTYTLTLPTTAGTASQFLQTDGSGTLTWATVTQPHITTDATTKSVYIGEGGDPTNLIPTGGTGAIRIGANAGEDLTSGSENLFIGNAAGAAITDSDNNIAIGFRPLSVGNGSQNAIAIGQEALYSASGGYDNIAIGREAGYNLIGGSNNILIGLEAGGNDSFSFNNRGVINGDNNIMIGVQNRFTNPSADLSDVIVIGNFIQDIAAPYTAIIGDYNITDIYFGSSTYAWSTMHGRGIQLTSAAKPTCDATKRGTIWYVAGGTGVADTTEVCRKDASNNYAWVSVY